MDIKFDKTSTRGVRYYSVEVQYAPVNVMLNAVKASLSAVALRTWMIRDVRPFFKDQIVELFSYEGRGIEGWAPLSAATLRNRSAADGDRINYVSGDMFNYFMENFRLISGGSSAELRIPGPIDDPVMFKKISTAQHGRDDTPARPVLIVDSVDTQKVIRLLQMHVMRFANTTKMMGGV